MRNSHHWRSGLSYRRFHHEHRLFVSAICNHRGERLAQSFSQRVEGGGVSAQRKDLCATFIPARACRSDSNLTTLHDHPWFCLIDLPKLYSYRRVRSRLVRADQARIDSATIGSSMCQMLLSGEPDEPGSAPAPVDRFYDHQLSTQVKSVIPWIERVIICADDRLARVIHGAMYQAIFAYGYRRDRGCFHAHLALSIASGLKWWGIYSYA